MPVLSERLAGPLSRSPKGSTRAASRQGSMLGRLGMLGSAFERKSQDKDPVMAFRGAEVQALKVRQDQVTQSGIAMLADAALLMGDNNELLRQIVEEVKNLQLATGQQGDQPGLDIDVDIDRKRRRTQARRGPRPGKPGGRPGAARGAPRPTAQPQQRPSATPPRPAAATRELGRAAIRQRIGSRVRQTIANRVATKIPGLGLLFALFFAGQRAITGDTVGAGLELASGAAAAAGPITFGFGTAVSIGLDVATLARDVYGEVYGVAIESDPQRDERLGTLTAAIREEIEEMISSSPRPQAPPLTSETRDQLVQLYRDAQEDDELRSVIGDDVMAGLVPLLRIDPTRPGTQNQAAREGMQRTLESIQRRLTRARPAQTHAAIADDATAVDLDTQSLEELLQLIRGAEFNDIKLEADKVRFDGNVKFTAGPTGTSDLVPTASSMGPPPATTAMDQAASPTAAQTPVPSPAAAAPAEALATGGQEMVVADQQQIRGGGQEIVIQQPAAPMAPQPQPVRLSAMGTGEVPLNIRLERQVA